MIRTELTNKRFGRLLVIDRSCEKKGTAWLCLCDCGKKTIVFTDNLQGGTTTSCGCYHREITGNRNRKYAKESGEASFHALICSYKKCARERNITFNLSEDEFRRLTKGICHYCGAIPSNAYHQQTTNGAYIYNGVDRVDSKLGYSSENCVSCCKRCNQAKNDMTEGEFIEWIHRVYAWTSVISLEVSNVTA